MCGWCRMVPCVAGEMQTCSVCEAEFYEPPDPLDDTEGLIHSVCPECREREFAEDYDETD